MALLTELNGGEAVAVGQRSPVYEPSVSNNLTPKDPQTLRSILILPIPSRNIVAQPVFRKYRDRFSKKNFIMQASPRRYWDYSTAHQASSLPYLRSQPMSGYQQSGESSRSQDEDWRHIEDPGERRKIQNRIAQRKYRMYYLTADRRSLRAKANTGDKEKRKREDDVRIAENQQVAGSAYAAPDAKDLARDANPTGLPWGSVSLKHVVETGKAKEERTQQASREGSAGPVYSRRTTQG